MSLGAWERQALEAIKEKLSVSDPRLAALLATFTRHVAGEAMPARTKLRARRPGRRPQRGARPHQGAAGRTGPGSQRPGFPRIALLVWLLSTAAMITVALTINGGSGQALCPAFGAVCASQAPAPQHHAVHTAAISAALPFRRGA